MGKLLDAPVEKKAKNKLVSGTSRQKTLKLDEINLQLFGNPLMMIHFSSKNTKYSLFPLLKSCKDVSRFFVLCDSKSNILKMSLRTFNFSHILIFYGQTEKIQGRLNC